MEKYVLKTKKGEIINYFNAISLDEAIEWFSLIKVLSTKQLLEIFIVEKAIG